MKGQDAEQMNVEESVCISSPLSPFTCHFTLRVAADAPPGQPSAYKIVVAQGEPYVEVHPGHGVLYAGESILVTLIIHRCPFAVNVLDMMQRPPRSFFTVREPGCPS